MRSIRDYEALRCVRATFPDTKLIAHIERRVELLMEQGFSDFTELAFFLIVEPGDSADDTCNRSTDGGFRRYVSKPTNMLDAPAR